VSPRTQARREAQARQRAASRKGAAVKRRTPKLIVQILQLALSLVESQTSGKAQSDATLAQTLLNIVQAAAQAYQSQTGQPIDPSLIKPEAAI